MTLPYMRELQKSPQCGLSYVEVLLALIILSVAVLPALESIRTGLQSVEVHEEVIVDHYRLLTKMQEVKATQFDDLLIAADAAGSHTTPTEYSDDAGVEQRRLVYLSVYDADNSDFDGNMYTILDPNTDGDGSPYTSAVSDTPVSLLWVSVEQESTQRVLQTLLLR